MYTAARDLLFQYGAVERSGVRQRYAGTLGGEPSGAGTMMAGTDTLAEAGLRIVFVLTLVYVAASVSPRL